ncbi:MAG: TolC family protein [Pirellulales bacterium]|nr:TolC family protein [Pirellulales bacterium]
MSDCPRIASLLLLFFAIAMPAVGDEPWHLIFPEQRRIEIRDPSCLPRAPLPRVPVPPTVTSPQADRTERMLSLDEAIGIALANTEVIRVLAGTGAAASGNTIYDPAIHNTEVDRARARFDPEVQLENQFLQTETPQPGIISESPLRVGIDGQQVETYDMDFGLSKTTATGGSLGLGVNANTRRTSPADAGLNPQARSTVDLSMTQPLLQGGGLRANLAPIEIARIDTERSFFQTKDSVQQSVRGVIEAYWAVVFARVDLWTRKKQAEQGLESLNVAEARQRTGFAGAAEVAQTRTAYANFRANVISAEANLLDREAALRNILGLPPSDPLRLVPSTAPTQKRLEVQWDSILETAERFRPDLIELKLILEADHQQLLMARNNALPQLNATGMYRWDGLTGRTPDREYISSEAGEFTGWQLGVNFSVPLGLRQGRASVRQWELLILRDRANLDQALHNTTHVLAASYRNLAEFYEQYRAFREAREAAHLNLDVQLKAYQVGRTIYLNVLQAITDWGNSVSAEAQALVQYNIELANLDQQTGVILESHGVRFVEERFAAIGPMGRMGPERCYPRAMRPGTNHQRYPAGDQPAESGFELEGPLGPTAPLPPKSSREVIPPPSPRQ